MTHAFSTCAAPLSAFIILFHTASALSAPAGHLPLEGKTAIRGYHPLKKGGEAALVNLSAPQIPSSRAKPRDLYCTAAICPHTPSLKRHLGASFLPFPRSRFTALQEGSLYFGPHDTQERRIVSYRFSYRCVELCLFEALYPAPSARAVWPHRKAP